MFLVVFGYDAPLCSAAGLQLTVGIIQKFLLIKRSQTRDRLIHGYFIVIALIKQYNKTFQKRHQKLHYCYRQTVSLCYIDHICHFLNTFWRLSLCFICSIVYLRSEIILVPSGDRTRDPPLHVTAQKNPPFPPPPCTEKNVW